MKGMPNFGNTCYFNSVLQCLLRVAPVTGDSEFLQEYQKLFKSGDEQSFIDTREVLKLFRNRFKQFDNGDQHDASEALICLLELLEPEVKDLVTSKLLQETVCTSGKTVRKEETSVVTLAPHNENIEDAFKRFTEWNTLDNYEDDNGKVWNVAVTRTLFECLPKVLIVSVTHKTNLKIHEFLGSFELVATCVHAGNHMSGHYGAFIKHDEKWFLMDDLQYAETPFPDEGGHCILFYTSL
jgi:ubiquitin C-terminal hydrolase